MSVYLAQNMWSATTRTFVYPQINQRISHQTGTLKPDLIRFPGCQENVLFWLKKQSFPRLLCHWQTVLWTQAQKTPPPLPTSFVASQQFKLQRFCFFGQDGHLWESKLRVTLPVRAAWDTSGGPEISEGPTSKGRRGDRLSQESCPLTSGVHSWPCRWCLKIGDGFPFFLWFKNQDSNLMLPLPSPWRRHQQSKPITTQTPPQMPLVWLRRQGWLNLKEKVHLKRIKSHEDKTTFKKIAQSKNQLSTKTEESLYKSQTELLKAGIYFRRGHKLLLKFKCRINSSHNSNFNNESNVKKILYHPQECEVDNYGVTASLF